MRVQLLAPHIADYLLARAVEFKYREARRLSVMRAEPGVCPPVALLCHCPGGGLSLAGKLTWMWRPPSGRAWVVMVALWAVAIAATMDRPRPCPLSLVVRVVVSRWKGSKRRPICAGGMTGPVLVTDRTAQPSWFAVVSVMVPRGMLCCTALLIRL